MVAWSGLLRSTGQILFRGIQIPSKIRPKNGANLVRAMSEHRIMPLTPTRWQWHKFKDLVHMYVLIGAIPCIITIVLSQIYVGPAELKPIPEGYEPKHWEYYRDPISRFIARYIYTSPQMEYEKYLHYLWTEGEQIKLRKLEKKIMDLMAERSDYQAWFYKPFDANYARSAHYNQHVKAEMGKGY